MRLVLFAAVAVLVWGCGVNENFDGSGEGKGSLQSGCTKHQPQRKALIIGAGLGDYEITLGNWVFLFFLNRFSSAYNEVVVQDTTPVGDAKKFYKRFCDGHVRSRSQDVVLLPNQTAKFCDFFSANPPPIRFLRDVVVAGQISKKHLALQQGDGLDVYVIAPQPSYFHGTQNSREFSNVPQTHSQNKAKESLAFDLKRIAGFDGIKFRALIVTDEERSDFVAQMEKDGFRVSISPELVGMHQLGGHVSLHAEEKEHVVPYWYYESSLETFSAFIFSKHIQNNQGSLFSVIEVRKGH